MIYDLLRGLHILAVIAWMAGLLYLPRLFVYHHKHRDQPELVAAFLVMEQNLLKIIMNPAMVVTWVLGCGLIYLNIHDRWGWKFLWEPWFIVKELGIILITLWHHYLALVFKAHQKGILVKSEKFWRMSNEIPFVLAIFMVLAVTTEFFTR